jgi:RNase III regulator ymdB
MSASILSTNEEKTWEKTEGEKAVANVTASWCSHAGTETANRKSQIIFVRGSVVTQQADAIVNAANQTLLGGGGVDGAIHMAAGSELLRECKALNGCETGQAKITKAYNIRNASYIIHTVGPVYRGVDEDAYLLAACYRNSLDLALAYRCRSIAFPCISTGAYGYPIEKAAKVSLLAAAQWLDAHPDVVMKIYFCCFNDREMVAYQKLAI